MTLTKLSREQDQFLFSKWTWTAGAICLHVEAFLLTIALEIGG